MFFKSLKLAAAMVLGLGVAQASAAVYTYDLSDHPNATFASKYDYGLRLDRYKSFFSFNNGASAQMVYDSDAGTATIKGTMIRSKGNGVFGSLWDVVYTMTGLTDMGDGTFLDENGKGTGSISSTVSTATYALGAKANRWGKYFVFLDDGNRLAGDPGEGLVGRGWVKDTDCCNDFLFRAELVPGSPGGVVPLPAAAWMLLSGVAGLGVISRRRRRS